MQATLWGGCQRQACGRWRGTRGGAGPTTLSARWQASRVGGTIVVDFILFYLTNTNFFLGKCASLYTRRETKEHPYSHPPALTMVHTHTRQSYFVGTPTCSSSSRQLVISPWISLTKKKFTPPPPVELLCCAQMTCQTFTLKSSQVPAILTYLSQESSDCPGPRNRKLGLTSPRM